MMLIASERPSSAPRPGGHPASKSRTRVSSHDHEPCKERNLIDRFFYKLKHFHRITTRYEQTASKASSLQLTMARQYRAGHIQEAGTIGAEIVVWRDQLMWWNGPAASGI